MPVRQDRATPTSERAEEIEVGIVHLERRVIHQLVNLEADAAAPLLGHLSIPVSLLNAVLQGHLRVLPGALQLEAVYQLA